MKKILIPVVALLLLGTALYSQRAAVVAVVMQKALENRVGTDITEDFVDGLHVALCGAGGPLPAPKASGPCVAVVAGDRLFVVDVGTDSPRNLGRMGMPVGRTNGVFLTHFHSDHIDGLGELATLRWAGGNFEAPLPVYGPIGVETVVAGFNQAYSQDFIYRQAHHGDAVTPLAAAGMTARPFETPADGVLVTLIDEPELKVEALAVDHEPVSPAVGYRFTYKGRTALISGDTSKSANLERFAKGIDLLVHDALAPNIVTMMNAAALQRDLPNLVKITEDIPSYHASPVEAAETARDAGVGHLLYYHIVPPLLLPGQDALFLDGAEDVFANYTIGVDGVMFSLPAGNDKIIQTSKGL